MTVNPMIEEGGTRVLDENGNTIGFVFTEPVRDAPESQIQRWILRRTRDSYRFKPWTKTLCMTVWKQMLTTPAPDAGANWGDAPENGLWVKDALYVVAQSTPVQTTKEKGGVPDPTYPQCTDALFDELSAHGPRKQEFEQIIIDKYVHDVKQFGNVVGHCFGNLNMADNVKKKVFKSAEYVVMSASASATVRGLDASPKSIVRGSAPCDNALKFHSKYGNLVGGTRYDVIGCCYYKSGDQPPPGDNQRLATFLFG